MRRGFATSYKMGDVCNLEMKHLVPVFATTPEETARSLSIRSAPESRTGLYSHQERAKRAALSSKAVLNMAHAGQGKTLAMIASVEQFRGAYGIKGVILISKKAILGYTKEDILGYVGRTTSLSSTQIYSFYQFYTYQTFNDNYGGLSPIDLKERMRGYILVLDECHTVMSYLTRPRPGCRSPYETLVLIRNLLPEALIIAMSATPMLNSPFEIQFAAHILLTREQLNRDFPGCEDHYAVALDGAAGWKPPEEEELPPPELFDDDLADDQRYAMAIVKNVAIMYKEPPRAARQRRYGTPFRLGLELAALVTGTTAPPYSGHLDTDPDIHVRAILPMGVHQRKAYVERFTKQQFYRSVRELSVCDADGIAEIIPEIPEHACQDRKTFTYWNDKVRQYSATFAYWIEIEMQARQEKHWGIGAWYLDDVVGKGAHVLENLFLKFGWRQWSDTLVQGDPRPVVLLLTGEVTLTREMRAQLFSPENIEGQLIRTIIYTGAVRDGVSFPGALRGGSVLGWSEAGQLQADARRLRVNSFDKFEKYLTDPEFLERNWMYVTETPAGQEINPHTYDVLVIPGGRISQEGLPIDDLRPHYSIDAHMLGIRARKGRDIQRIFDILKKGSIDIVAESPAPSLVGNYITHNHHPDNPASLAVFDPRSRPQAISRAAAPGIPIEVLGYYADRAFFFPLAREVEGPAGGTRDYLWGLGSMGLGPAPADLAMTAAADFGDPENMNILHMLLPSDDEMCTLLRAILRRALDALADAMLRTGGMNPAQCAEALDYQELAKLMGSAPMVLLAMYSRLWCTGPFEGKLAFAEKFPTKRADPPQTENTLASKWSTAPTLLYDPSREAPTRETFANWYPPHDAQGIWRDPSSIQAFIQRWSNGYDNDLEYAIITNQLNIKKVTFYRARPPAFMLGPGEELPKGRVGKQATGELVPLQGAALMVALNYNERDPRWSNEQYGSLGGFNSSQGLRNGAVYRYVLMPENDAGIRPSIDPIDIKGGPVLGVVGENAKGHAKQYLSWAARTIRNRLTTYWTATTTTTTTKTKTK
jgi:hypothetical protein